jgi:hypothetical protein
MTQVEEEEVSDAELRTTILYLNSLSGGKSSIQYLDTREVSVAYTTSVPSREVTVVIST